MKKIFLWMFVLIFFISSVSAASITSFTDSTTNRNITFSNKYNYGLYLDIPRYANISIANITLTGINWENDTCYQSNANISSGCGGLATGEYYRENTTQGDLVYNPYTATNIYNASPSYAFFDNNISTCALNNLSTRADHYINYTIPNGTIKAKWTVQYVQLIGLTFVSNITYEIPHYCLQKEKLQLWHDNYANQISNAFYCKNNVSSWVLLGGAVLSADCMAEESIIWDYYYMKDPTLNISSDEAWNYTGFYNETQVANFTDKLNNINENCDCTNCTLTSGVCRIPFDFYINRTNTSAILEYKDLSILYNYSLNLLLYEEGEPTLYTTQNVTIDLVGETHYYSHTTDSGNITINVEPDTYQLRYNTSGFLENFIFFTQNPTAQFSRTLYLLESTGLTNVTATVYDERGSLLPNAVIKVLELENGNFVERQTIASNFEGEARLNLKLNTQFYKFMLYYPSTTLKETTEPTYIYSDTLTFQINTEEDVTENFYRVNDITYTLTFSEATDAFTFTYSDPNSLGSEYCLYVYELGITGKTSYNNSCITTSSGSITRGALNVSGQSYIAETYLTIGGDYYFIDQKVFTYASQNVLKNSKFGLFIIALMTIFFVFISKKIIEMALFAPIPLVIGAYMNIINIPISYGIALEILAIILVVAIKRDT